VVINSYKYWQPSDFIFRLEYNEQGYFIQSGKCCYQTQDAKFNHEYCTSVNVFKIILNGYFMTVSVIRLNDRKKRLMKLVAGLPYKINFYQYPYEIKLLQRIWK